MLQDKSIVLLCVVVRGMRWNDFDSFFKNKLKFNPSSDYYEVHLFQRPWLLAWSWIASKYQMILSTLEAVGAEYVNHSVWYLTSLVLTQCKICHQNWNHEERHKSCFVTAIHILISWVIQHCLFRDINRHYCFPRQQRLTNFNSSLNIVYKYVNAVRKRAGWE